MRRLGFFMLAACSSMPELPQPPLPPMPPAPVAACHVAHQEPVQCAPAASLNAQGLGEGFFSEVSTSVGLTGKYGRRVAWGDVNGDHFPDFIGIETGTRRGLQHLYLSHGGQSFEEVTAGSGITANRDGTDGGQTSLMAVFADVDGDGDLDLFSGSYSQTPTSTTDANELYLNDGTGHFTLAPMSGVNQPWPLTTAAATFLDFDLDGKLDLYVGNFMINYPDQASYASNLYRGDGAGHFTLANDAAKMSMTAPVGDPSAMYVKPTYGVTACDINDDGWPDILTSTYALGWNDLWLNQKDGTFKNVGPSSKFYMDDTPNPAEMPYRWGGNGFASVCGDYDNDGDLDVFNAETTHGDYPRNTADRSRILVNDGAVFSRPSLVETGINRQLNGTGTDGDHGDEGDHGAAWVDLNGDGLLDLVIENSAYVDSHAWIYQQLPNHTFVNVTEQSGVRDLLVNTNGISIDDFDRDGDLDVLMGSVNTGSGQAPGGVEQIHLFRNEVGNKASWLYVTLKGVSANRQGIGARVTVTAGCLTQTREISGGKGTFGAGDPAYAHFGLGDLQRIDRIEVRWPTNPVKVQVLSDVAVNQFLEITEDQDELSCEGPATH
jgi:hypothetical protein